jgi:hypothetical protein
MLYYPLQEFFEAEIIYDTHGIQKLIWSICSGMVVARWLKFE